MPSFSVPTTCHRASLGALFSHHESGPPRSIAKKIIGGIEIITNGNKLSMNSVCNPRDLKSGFEPNPVLSSVT